jgi:hypothetical protein
LLRNSDSDCKEVLGTIDRVYSLESTFTKTCVVCAKSRELGNFTHDIISYNDDEYRFSSPFSHYNSPLALFRLIFESELTDWLDSFINEMAECLQYELKSMVPIDPTVITWAPGDYPPTLQECIRRCKLKAQIELLKLISDKIKDIERKKEDKFTLLLSEVEVNDLNLVLARGVNEYFSDSRDFEMANRVRKIIEEQAKCLSPNVCRDCIEREKQLRKEKVIAIMFIAIMFIGTTKRFDPGKENKGT